jgi:adenylate cyclase
MVVEIERKFLVADDSWRGLADGGQRIRQAYLASSATNTVRIRVIDESTARLTIKSGFRGLTRDEFEYDIPVSDAIAMLVLRESSVIDKTRYNIERDGLIWEVDVYAGDNAGLVIAEVELDDESRAISLPDWIKHEVSGDARYQNSALAAAPYTTWNLSK